MPKGRKIKRQAVSMVLPFNVINPLPIATLFPFEESSGMRDAMVKELAAFHDAASGFTTQLAVIASEYLIARARYEEDRLPQVRRRASALQRNLKKVTAALEDISIETAVREEVLLSGTAGMDSNPNDWLGQFKREVALVHAACNRTIRATARKKGTRQKDHLTLAVTELALVWSQVSGKPYGKNFNLDDGRFTSPGSEFIYRMMNAMDSELNREDVKGAITRLDVTKLTSESSSPPPE